MSEIKGNWATGAQRGIRVGGDEIKVRGDGTEMPHASDSLLDVGNLLPLYVDWGGSEPPPIPPVLKGVEDNVPFSEEEWLRELAARIGRMAPRFGLIDKKIRRELELAERMLNSYAVLWERRNEAIREDINKRGEAL